MNTLTQFSKTTALVIPLFLHEATASTVQVNTRFEHDVTASPWSNQSSSAALYAVIELLHRLLVEIDEAANADPSLEAMAQKLIAYYQVHGVNGSITEADRVDAITHCDEGLSLLAQPLDSPLPLETELQLVQTLISIQEDCAHAGD